MKSLLTIFVNISNILIVCVYLNACNKRIIPNRKIIILLLCLILSYFHKYQLKPLDFTLEMLSIYVLCAFVYTLNQKTAIFTTILINITYISVELVCYFVLKEICNIVFTNSSVFGIYIIISLLLKGVLMYLYLPLKNMLKNSLSFQPVMFVLLLPVTLIILIFGVLQDIEHLNFYMEIGICLVFFINLLFLFVLNKIQEANRLQLEIEELKVKQRINVLYSEHIVQKLNSSRRYIHDFNKHVNILNRYVCEENYDEMKNYLNLITQHSQEIKNQSASGNKLLDLVIRTVFEKHNALDLELHYEKIDDFTIHKKHLYDVVTIFYNLLENAVEECEILEKSLVIVAFYKEGDNAIVMKVYNSSENKDCNLETGKENKDFHGIGIYSIQQTVEKLSGTLLFQYDKALKLFQAAYSGKMGRS